MARQAEKQHWQADHPQHPKEQVARAGAIAQVIPSSKSDPSWSFMRCMLMRSSASIFWQVLQRGLMRLMSPEAEPPEFRVQAGQRKEEDGPVSRRLRTTTSRLVLSSTLEHGHGRRDQRRVLRCDRSVREGNMGCQRTG
jgi:hypothetical protein